MHVIILNVKLNVAVIAAAAVAVVVVAAAAVNVETSIEILRHIQTNETIKC